MCLVDSYSYSDSLLCGFHAGIAVEAAGFAVGDSLRHLEDDWARSIDEAQTLNVRLRLDAVPVDAKLRGDCYCTRGCRGRGRERYSPCACYGMADPVCLLFACVCVVHAGCRRQHPWVFRCEDAAGRRIVVKVLFTDSTELRVYLTLTGNTSLRLVPVLHLFDSPIGEYDGQAVCAVCMLWMPSLRDAMWDDRVLRRDPVVVVAVIVQLLQARESVWLGAALLCSCSEPCALNFAACCCAVSERALGKRTCQWCLNASLSVCSVVAARLT